MSDTEIPPQFEEDGVLDNPLRAIIVINSPDIPEGEMEERLLDTIQSFEDMNAFFDKFDETVAIPNEEHIKYEVGSDGMVVVLVDSKEVKDKVVAFFDEYVGTEGEGASKQNVAEDEGREIKKAKRGKN
ncbi:hypothetical protein CLIB1423_06S02190 [[Candida] railenensis]|uniref:DUF1892-domain-containing protein n=1 Tax=[Candida] railenensis TaxID=45579 RepID=A0A9P0VY63_9ASCO|nr:hypothetical protein CLIB1423_06S02190 [[Candida] railenensis]